MTGPVRIRPAQRADVPLLFAFVVELAEYERAAELVVGSEQQLDAALFGPDPVAEAVVAEVDAGTAVTGAAGGGSGAVTGAAGVGSATPTPAGFALFFRTFSTWLCRPGMWLEDLYVSPRYRRIGVGRALLSHLAELAVERGCGRLEWSALHWNKPALDFYESIGAERLHEWEGFRLDGAALRAVARSLK